MEPYQHIIFEQDGPVAVIKLNRPEVLNAFSRGMGQELERAFRFCDREESVRVVVLTGEGRAFCSGADFSRGSQVFDAPADRPSFQSDPFDFHAWDIRKPTIAAINGHAVGLGLTLALQCDLRIIADDAKCGIVQNRRGVFPDLRSHWTLPRTVGFARAMDLMLTGRMFSGSEAAEMGLASRALPADQVLEAAVELAHDIAVNVAPVSVALSKRLLWSEAALSARQANELERLVHLHVMGAADAQEGPAAWAQKRDPEWKLTLRDDWPAWMDGANRGVGGGSGTGAAGAGAGGGATYTVAGTGPLADGIAEALSQTATQTSTPATLDLLVYVCPSSTASPQTEPTPLVEMSPQQWAAEVEDVLADALASLKNLHQPLKTAQGQVIFVIPSFAMSGAEGFAATAAAAEGLRALAKSTAKQWGTDKIRVNTIALDPQHFIPGPAGQRLSQVMGLAASSGFGHPGDIARDIAPAIAMLQSPQAHFLTGATLTLDGGVWMAS